MWLHKQPIPNGPPEALRLFMICEAMNWSQLPVAGGIYDQHPAFMEAVQQIFIARSEHDRQEEAKKKRDQRAKKGAARL